MVKTTLWVKFYKSGSQECDRHGLAIKPDVCYNVEHSGSTSVFEHVVFCFQLNHRQPIFEQPDLVESVSAHGRGVESRGSLGSPPTQTILCFMMLYGNGHYGF